MCEILHVPEILAESVWFTLHKLLCLSFLFCWEVGGGGKSPKNYEEGVGCTVVDGKWWTRTRNVNNVLV